MSRKFGNTINRSIENILLDALNGKYPVNLNLSKESNLFGSGVSVSIGQGLTNSTTPKERNIVSLAPRASILIKKKAFSTLKYVNDLQWMDRTEKMLLRATKVLFAYKVAQIRAYESLTKVETYFQETSEINLRLFAELLHNAKFLSVPQEENISQSALELLVGAVSSTLRDAAYDEIKEDVLKILERNAFASDLELTTWIVDPNNVDNYETGPGTGVIELGIFSNFGTTVGLNSEPSSASFEVEDPYRILNITDEDIEVAIGEALLGSLGLIAELSNPSVPTIDFRSSLASGLELLGFGNFDSTLNVDYIRDRLRAFYLGRTIINPGDGIHFYIRGNKSLQDYSNEVDTLDRDYFVIDEVMLEAERILFTNGKIDFETYKNLRQFSDNSFGMHHVWGGFIARATENWAGGRWTLKVDATDNMGWLKWSRFMLQPGLQDPQGILEDPLTPYEIKTDAQGQVLSASGPQLLEENKQLLRSGLLSYDSGILNGQIASESNLLQGQYNKSGSLSKVKILQHPQGLVYRWKNGIITATAAINVVDPLNESQITQKVHNQTYGLNVSENILNNLDIANILSLLIVGQPYNVESFIDQAYQAHNINKQSASSSLSGSDPLSSVLDVIRRQNNYFGGFRPYRMITMSNATLTQTASTNQLRNDTNLNIKQLQVRRAQIESILKQLKQNTGINGILINSLNEEKRSIDSGIKEQIEALQGSGAVSSVDLLTENFNLFGRSRTLPLTGNFNADHQITRAMTLIGAQRRIEDVRLNRDQNLFIVSDQYDEQTDIRPFLFKLRDSNYKIFSGQFIGVYEKCVEAANIVNLEFFANTQGHIEFRPPQWNRTPLSVLQAMFEINKSSNKKIVPEFLLDVFQTKSDSLRREIHSFNIRIVLISLLLGKYPDRALIPNFNSNISSSVIPAGTGTGKASLNFFGLREVGVKDSGEQALELQDGDFNATIGNLVDTGSQLFGNGLNLSAGLGEKGDILNGDTETLLGIFDQVFQEQNNIVQDVLTVATQPTGQSAVAIANASNLNKIREEFIRLSGLDPGPDLAVNNGKFVESDFIFNKSFASQNSEADQIAKANNYLQKLQETISNRDKLVTILQRNLEKEQELSELENILSGEFTKEEKQEPEFLDNLVDVISRASNTVKTITDIFTGDASQGSLFDHLIEDDSRNLLGPGSGRRYIIEEHDILSCTYSEDPPEFCRVDVVGDAPIIASGLSGAFDDRYYWAGATDFDLWRQYGYMPKEIPLPFASSAELQCKPFAILELQLQRVKINKANLTVVGNEYYEPGDVVFIPDKGLLYYLRSVSHNFDHGGSFTTSLVLEFGHPPGNYLPSPLDIIGQQYIKEPLFGSTMVYRNSNGDDAYKVLQPDSGLIFPPQTITIDSIPTLLDYKDNAVRFTNMMIELSSLLIQNRVVLIRGFVNGRDDPELERVRNNLAVVKHLLQNPVLLTQSNPTSTGDDLIDGASSFFETFGAEVGTTKGTTSMVLPNGLPVISVPSAKIMEQVVFLDKEGDVNQIQSLSPDIFSEQSSGSAAISQDIIDALFPKGGPKQRTWLDIKSGNGSFSVTNKMKVSNVIEIGLLEINDDLLTSTETTDPVSVDTDFGL